MKVTVVGAGPAGSTAALFLAEAGVETELVDKCRFPRDKPCAGGLFNPLLYYRDFPYLEEVEGVYIHEVRFRCGRHAAAYSSKKPLMKTLLRSDLDHFLLKKALAAGARFSLSEASPPESGARSFDANSREGEVFIDAAGARRAQDYPRCGICLVYDFKTDGETGAAQIHYGFMGIMGFCWLYPKRGYANIGVGAYMPQQNVREVYRTYVEHLVSEGVVGIAKKDLRNMPHRAKILPFAPRAHFVSGGALLAGDSAGFVNPSTGEGIYFAMLSGKLAAKTVIEKRPLAWYEAQCRSAFKTHLAPVRFGNNRALLNRVLERAVGMSAQDERFKMMIAENFFRLGSHNLTGRFLRNLVCRVGL